MLKKAIITLILSLPLSVWAQPTSDVDAQQALIHDLNALANASCLIKQKDAYLQNAGYIWANSLAEGNMEFNLETVLLPMKAAIEKAIANTPMYSVPSEQPPLKSQALPIAYCFDVIYQPNVQALIRELSKKYSRLGKKTN
ncbi:hypothetical protein [Oligella sp. HMSC05A10]|uniref:hypothetical protein n=1 Tax=Oligella sp. HMSC05A10 TaxID=1581112 RepID=UPI000A984078|nr:hypothetical protein [Oligella sp. HMSC05A10]